MAQALNGTIDGDIEQAKSTRMGSQQASPKAPKPAGFGMPSSRGIDAGLNQASQQKPAKLGMPGSQGIDAGLSPGANGALTAATSRPQGQAAPKPAGFGMSSSRGIDAGLNQASQQEPAGLGMRGKYGIDAGLSPGANGALTAATSRPQGQAAPKPAGFGMSSSRGIDAGLNQASQQEPAGLGMRGKYGIDAGLTAATGKAPNPSPGLGMPASGGGGSTGKASINPASASAAPAATSKTDQANKQEGILSGIDSFMLGNPATGAAIDTLGALTAVPADGLRNMLVEWSGGDPDSVEGGRNKIQDEAFGRMKERADYIGDIWSDITGGLKSAVLSGTGAKESTTPDQKPGTTTTGTKADTSAKQDTAVSTTTAGNSAAAGDDGILRDLNNLGNYSFSGSNIAEFTPNDTTTTMNMSGPGKVVNAAFERAIAAGDYETALQMANRSDANQMTRLGQLQGNIRSRREQELAASKAGGGIDQGLQQTAQKMLERAQYLAENNSSKAAQRLSSEARGLLGLGVAAQARGSNGPVSPLTEGIDTAASLAQQQAQADTASMTAEQARTEQQRQQELQGILQGLNDPNLEPNQRQSLLQRYSALMGGKNYVETEVIVGRDREGSPLLAKVQMDPITGQTLGGIDGGIPSYKDALIEAQAAIAKNPKSKPVVNAMLMQMYGMGLPDKAE